MPIKSIASKESPKVAPHRSARLEARISVDLQGTVRRAFARADRLLST